MHTFISPLFVDLPRRTGKPRRIRLNLNEYRNTHHQLLNQAKVQYCSEMAGQLKGVKFGKHFMMSFRLFKKTRRKTDKANILSIVEKFFCDALTHYNCIPDDDDEVIIEQRYLRTEHDPVLPRVEITIWEVE